MTGEGSKREATKPEGVRPEGREPVRDSGAPNPVLTAPSPKVEQRHRDRVPEIASIFDVDCANLHENDADAVATAFATFERDLLTPSGAPSAGGEGLDIDVQAQTYRDMHETAVEMGYPSLTEALEHLDELRSTPSGDDEGRARITKDSYPEIIQAIRWSDEDNGTEHFEPGVGFVVDDPDGVSLPVRWLPHLDEIEKALAGLDHQAPHPLDVDVIEWLAREGEEPTLNESAVHCFVSGEHTPVMAMANSTPELWVANRFLNEYFEGWAFDPSAGFEAALTPPPAPTEAAGLREALEPFAELADNFVGDDEDDQDLYKPPLYEHQMHVKVGDLRRAAAALAKSPPAAVERSPELLAVAADVLALSKDAARKDGMKIGEWVSRRMREAAERALTPKPLGDVREGAERNRTIALRGAEYLRRLGEGGWGDGDIADAQYCADTITALCLQPLASLAAPAVPDREGIIEKIEGIIWERFGRADENRFTEVAGDIYAAIRALKPGSQS